MPKLVAIDWDSHELRYVLAESYRGALRDVHWEALPWDAAEAQGLTAGSLEAVRHLIQDAPFAQACGLIVARREHLERFFLSVPPATDNELFDLIENHLSIEQTLGADDLIYDFVTLSGDSQSPRQLAATAAPAQLVDEYRELAAALRLKRPRLLVRAGGIAARQRRSGVPTEGATLIVVPLVEEVDLAVMADDKLWYWRTIYSSPVGESKSFQDFLATELVRTLAVADEQLPQGVAVEQVSVFIGDADNQLVVRTLADALDLPVHQLPPLPDDESDNAPVCQAGKFAPLWGLLADEAAGQRPAIDLFSPTRPARKPSKQRQAFFVACAVVSLLGLAAFWAWDQIDQVENQAAQLSAELQKIRASTEELEGDAATLATIRRWEASGMVWLDELLDLTVRFPPPGMAVVLDFTANPDNSGGFVIRLAGKAREPGIVTDLDGQLRDEFRQVLSRNFREEPGSVDDLFDWRFESTVNSRSRTPEQYRQALSRFVDRESTGGIP